MLYVPLFVLAMFIAEVSFICSNIILVLPVSPKMLTFSILNPRLNATMQ